MKHTIPFVLALLLLTGCGRTSELPAGSSTLTIETAPTVTDETAQTLTETSVQTVIEENAQTAPQPDELSDEAKAYDIELTLERNEILIGYDDPSLVVRAVPEAQFSPETVQLVNADTGELVCTLYDDNDYNAHGDNIQGDGWYCNRWTAPTDFGTDPAVSEELELHFYAEFTQDGVSHRSATVRLCILEPFTDEELAAQGRVDDAITELMQSEQWEQGDTDTRRKLAVELLRSLADEGLVIFDEEAVLDERYDTISYEYASGGLGAIGVEDFRSDMN